MKRLSSECVKRFSTTVSSSDDNCSRIIVAGNKTTNAEWHHEKTTIQDFK